MATFTLRPKVDIGASDDWLPYALKSDPTKDWWEHIFAADDDIYLYSANNNNTIGTKCAISEDDISSISSADGKVTYITCYARGKVVGSGTFRLNALVGAYGAYTEIEEADGYVTAEYECTQYDDLADLWDLEMGGHIGYASPTGVKTLDYVYCIVTYTPAAPSIWGQAITALDEGELATLTARVEYCTWIKEWGFEVRLKSTGALVKKVTWSGVKLPNVTWNTELGTDDLEYGTTYEGRGYAVTDDGTGVGAWVEFTTRAAPYAVTTEATSQVGVDHAKGNGTTVIDGASLTERGFEVKLEFSGTLLEAIHYHIAGFEGNVAYAEWNTWEGTLVKTVTETGTFSEGAFIGDLGRFPQASFNDKLFAATTYDYRAYAIIDGETYFGDYVEFTTAHHPPGEGPDDVISPAVPIIEPVLVEDELFEPWEWDWPDIVFPDWDWPDWDIPPFDWDWDITFGRIFGAFLRRLDTKKDWETLREKCIIYQENMNQFTLTVNHNTLVLKNLVNDIITYIDGDVYPSDLKLMSSSQQLTPLYLEPISPDGFKDIINDFRLKDVCNVFELNQNFKKMLNSLNSLYEGDYSVKPISYNTREYTDIQPTAKRMILQLEDMRKKSKEVQRLIIKNIRRIFTYV